jgi:hypothetical protein
MPLTFSVSKIYVEFPSPLARMLLMKSNNFISISINLFPNENLITPKQSYPGGKLLRGPFGLADKFSGAMMKIRIMFLGNYLEHSLVCVGNCISFHRL